MINAVYLVGMLPVLVQTRIFSPSSVLSCRPVLHLVRLDLAARWWISKCLKGLRPTTFLGCLNGTTLIGLS